MTYEESVFLKYRGRRVFPDSNLLLLFFIGSFERNRVEAFKRTASFTVHDFDALAIFLREFRTVVTTPHVLTEVNGLANALPGYLKPAWSDHFAYQITLLGEICDASAEIVQETSFNPFGLTDAAIQKASRDTLVLTDDFRLSGYLRAQSVDTLNFRDLIA